jgi:hypothetical protein
MYSSGSILLSDGWSMSFPETESTCTLIGPNAHGEPWYDCPAAFDFTPYVDQHIREAGLDNHPPVDFDPNTPIATICWNSEAGGEQPQHPPTGEMIPACPAFLAVQP